MSNRTSKQTRRQFLTGSAGAAGLYGLWHGAGRPAVAGLQSGPGASGTASWSGRPPNFLIILVDEERFPPGYETAQITQWRTQYLRAQETLRDHGLEFVRHYTAATACAPARGSFFTGQYPSLHGVTQTTGVAKTAFENDTFWLDPGTVPTIGDYFRAAGYQTFYKGKWHVSDADILTPGTHTPLPSYDPNTGVRDLAIEQIYLDADRLDTFGFSGWIGPEPHGKAARDSGSSAATGVSGRDIGFTEQVLELFDQLESRGQSQAPWLTVASFVNPHDIALFGFFSTHLVAGFDFTIDPTIPFIPDAPTSRERLRPTKPTCQASYRRTYQEALQPTFDSRRYRQYYYQLQKNVDQQIQRVLARLQHSRFYDNTIVLYLSDHGELLGAHGGLHQKWHCAYEEAIHVPLIIANPRLFRSRQAVDMLTSHIDVLPTLLGLAGLREADLQATLALDHTEVHPLVGRDLSPLVLGTGTPQGAGEPVYFMTDDEPTKGTNQENFTGFTYNSVRQPNHIETVIATLASPHGPQIWKYSRYFDNPQFWADPGTSDTVLEELGNKLSICAATTKTQPVPDQLEMYNLTTDPYERTNLAWPGNATAESMAAQVRLAQLLAAQCQQKRLYPTNGTIAGKPACSAP